MQKTALFWIALWFVCLGPLANAEPNDGDVAWGQLTLVSTPEEQPTDVPAELPTDIPTETPTETPSGQPTEEPSDVLTDAPPATPDETPTDAPTEQPTDVPTEQPTDLPPETPTDVPTEQPTETPGETPKETPSETLTATPTETPSETPTETPTETSTPTPTLPCSLPTVSEFGGFDPGEAPKLDEIINLPSAGLVPNPQDPTFEREHWIWTIRPDDYCGAQISEYRISLPLDSEIPYDWSLDVTVQTNSTAAGDLPEISIDFGRGGSFIVVEKHVDGSERVLDVRAGIFADESGTSIVQIPGTAAANGEECRSIAGRRMAIRTTTHTKLRPDPVYWGSEALSSWAQTTFPNGLTIADRDQFADRLASEAVRSRTVAVIAHGLNSEFHFRPDPAIPGAPANNLPRIFTVDDVAPFLQRLRAGIGNNEIPGLYFTGCCTANTQGNNDLLTALTRAGSPIAEACGSIRRTLLERQIIRAVGAPIAITTEFIEEGSWRCVLRPAAANN